MEVGECGSSDSELAEKSIFKGIAASGWHTAAIAMRLLVNGGLPLANGIIGLGGELSWPRPTRAAFEPSVSEAQQQSEVTPGPLGRIGA